MKSSKVAKWIFIGIVTPIPVLAVAGAYKLYKVYGKRKAHKDAKLEDKARELAAALEAAKLIH